MTGVRQCWWCGRSAEVDTEAERSNGLLRDDSTRDGSESWICEEGCERDWDAWLAERGMTP